MAQQMESANPAGISPIGAAYRHGCRKPQATEWIFFQFFDFNFSGNAAALCPSGQYDKKQAGVKQ
jgi:hypothetical protein